MKNAQPFANEISLIFMVRLEVVDKGQRRTCPTFHRGLYCTHIQLRSCFVFFGHDFLLKREQNVIGRPEDQLSRRVRGILEGRMPLASP
ncbi:hypothetical protein RRG08_067274 [Elysia crispata]|uniref:Uncharacterized protein n=1 Tax=Elysia crispata TaxID=231223 RepID=A0AAE0ZBC9_9GAST|nr:hypothetical protein RRG08_067274 [Elysia crispata]